SRSLAVGVLAQRPMNALLTISNRLQKPLLAPAQLATEPPLEADVAAPFAAALAERVARDAKADDCISLLADFALQPHLPRDIALDAVRALVAHPSDIPRVPLE